MDLFEYADAKTVEEKKPKKPKKDQPEEPDSQSIVYTVASITAAIKKTLVDYFSDKLPVTIEGQLSNYRGQNASGHMYFSLKDDKAILPCVFFRHANAQMKLPVKEGDQVQVRGKIEVYEKGGKYQLVVEHMQPQGLGSLYEQFLLLKEKLQSEGLFDPEHKKPLPFFPKRIGVITSKTGSVFRDIIHVISARAPMTEIILLPAQVQGDGSAQIIASQIKAAQDPALQLDVLIVGRGGGSMEDLWAFNEEVVARAVHASTLPIISAVGHQTDTTICDFVADRRAATPSQAAEFAVPDAKELYVRIAQKMQAITSDANHGIAQKKQWLEALNRSPYLRDPRTPLNQRMQYADDLRDRLTGLAKHILPMRTQAHARQRETLARLGLQNMERQHAKLKTLKLQLTMLNPKNILSRGYSIVEKNNHGIISKTQQVKSKDVVKVTVSDGSFECEVIS